MLKNITCGYCHCGCGEKTKLARCDYEERGWIKGEPLRFLHGHQVRIRTAGRSEKWTGKEYDNHDGYMLVYAPLHPNASTKGCIKRSRFVVEKAMGKYLPKGSEVHHVNEIKNDDRPQNLVACQDRAYHFFLHRQQRALDACGNAKWRKCPFCKKYDDLQNLIDRKGHFVHNECKNKHARDLRKRKKEMCLC